jgi:hypothetical protein
VSAWDRFRRELEAISESERRAEWARQIVARFQRDLAEDPPAWLLAAAGSRAMEAVDSAYHSPRPTERSPQQRREEMRALEEQAKTLAEEIRRDRVAREVDRAIERGTIMSGDRDRWLEEFGIDPDAAAERLDPSYTGSGRQLSDEQEREQIARELGIRPEEVI